MFWGCVAALLVEWYCDTHSGREPVPFVTWTVCFGTGGRLHGDLELKLESRVSLNLTKLRHDEKNISVEKCPNEDSSIKVQMETFLTETTDIAGSSFTHEYTIKARLGDGGTASVYSAVHNSLGECVAVKVALRKKQERRWARTKSVFQHEMCMLKRCEHPHIVRSLAFFQGPQDVALVLEHVPGGDFQQVLERHGALAEHTVLVVVAQLVSALAHMHSLDTLHRDVKLENLLLVRFGAAPCIKLCDLGHAALVCEAGDSFTGTCGYAAPEVCQRAFPFWSRSADVWSVGCVTYAMLANSLLTWAGEGGGDGGPDFSSRTLQAVTLETRLLIRSMLHMNRAERTTLANIASVVATAGSTDSLKATSIQATSIRRVALSQHSYSLLDMTSLDKGQSHVRRAPIEMRWSTLSINSANDSPFTSRAASDVSDLMVSLDPDDAQHGAQHGTDSAHYGAQHGTAAAPAAEAAAEAFEGFPGARRRLPGARFECWKRPFWAQYAPFWTNGRSAYARDVHVEAGGVCTVEPSTGRVTNRWPFGQLLAITVDDLSGEISLELDDGGLACCGLMGRSFVRRVQLRLARASEQPVLLALLRAGMARCTTSTAPAAASRQVTRQASAAPPPALPLSQAPTRVGRATQEGILCMPARTYSLASALGDMRSFL